MHTPAQRWQAQAGSGKTCAFVLGLLQVWVSAPGAEMRDVRGLHSVFVSAPQPLTRQMIFLRTFVRAR